jgi:hypothetical protein
MEPDYCKNLAQQLNDVGDVSFYLLLEEIDFFDISVIAGKKAVHWQQARGQLYVFNSNFLHEQAYFLGEKIAA